MMENAKSWFDIRMISFKQPESTDIDTQEGRKYIDSKEGGDARKAD